MIVYATENQLEDVAALALKLFPETGSDTIHEEMRALLSDGNAAIFCIIPGKACRSALRNASCGSTMWKEREAARLAIWKESLWKNPAVNKALRKNCSGGQRLGQRKRAVRNLPAIASWGTRKAYPFTKALVFGKQTASSVLRSSCNAGPGYPP